MSEEAKPKFDLKACCGLKAPNDQEQAMKIFKDIGVAFYFVGSLTIVVSPFLGQPGGSLDGVLYVILGFAIHKLKSRTAALLALLLTAASLWATFANKFFGGEGGRNLFLSAMFVVASIGATRASFWYHKEVGSKFLPKNLLIKTVCALIYGFVAWFLTMIFVTLFEYNTSTDGSSPYDSLLFIPIVLFIAMTYFGWLPFTKNKPLCVTVE